MYLRVYRKVNKNVKLPFRKYSTHEQSVIKSKIPDVSIPKELIHEYVWRNLDRWYDKTALVCVETERSYTFGEVHKYSKNLSSNLRTKLKLGAGDTVGIILNNIPEYPIAFLGSLEAGLIVTTVNPMYTADEISKQLVNSGTKLIFTLPDLLPTIKQALKNAKRSVPIVIIKTNSSTLHPEGSIKFEELCQTQSDCMDPVKKEQDNVAVLPFSSGTTGLSKGVQLTHRNIVANLCQISEEHFKLNLKTEGNTQDVVPVFLPLFHIYGLVPVFLNMFSEGCKLVTVPKFGTAIFRKLLTKYKPTLTFGVPPVVLMLLNNPSLRLQEIDYIRLLVSAAAPLGSADVERFCDMTKGKMNLIQMYGMSETSPLTLSQTVYLDNGIKIGGSGFLIPNTHCKIVAVNGNTTEALPVGQSGEILIRGPQNMLGYLNNPEATKDVLLEDGWLRTGDIGHYDEDEHFFVTDRLKELIKVKGFQVAPAELEEILRSHLAVNDAAVIGVPHEIHGEVPKAFVELKNGFSATDKQLQEFVASKVTSYKCLTGGVVFLDAIPKNPSGKTLRRHLKKL